MQFLIPENKHEALFILLLTFVVFLATLAVGLSPTNAGYIAAKDKVMDTESKVPRHKEPINSVAKDINNSTGQVLVDQTIVYPAQHTAISLTIYPSNARIIVPSEQITLVQDLDPAYRRINLESGVTINIKETIDQIRIKLQNTGWIIF